MKYFFLALFFFLFVAGYAQKETSSEIRVSGTVTWTDEYDEPAIGVGIYIKENPCKGTYTDIDGKYSIDAPKGSVLVFVSVGCERQEIKLGSQSIINVSLKAEESEISSGPIIYTLAGNNWNASTANVVRGNTPDIALGRPNTEESLLQAYVPGVYFANSGVMDRSVLNIRSRNNRIGGEVRYVVDGIPDAPFNPADVENVFVSKDVSSASLYGTAAASGGIVHVRTKEALYTKLIEVKVNAWVGVRNVSRLLPYEKTDSFDEFLRTGFTQHYDLTLSKRWDKLNILGSLSYDNVEGAINSTRAERLTSRLKLDYTINKWMRIDQNLFYERSERKQVFLQGDNLETTYVESALNIQNYNPKDQMYSATSLVYSPFDWLTAKSIFSYDWIDSRADSSNESSVTPSYMDGFNHRMLNNSLAYQWMSDNTISFNLNHAHNHALYFLAGYTATETKMKLGHAPYQPYRQVEESRNDIQARGTYNYRRGKGTITASLRRSSSSLLSPDKDYAYFPAVSGTWAIVSDYEADFLSGAKLKASWGEIGSTNAVIPYYMISGRGATNSENSSLSYTGLKWQKTEQINLGSDLSFLSSKFSLSVNYFQKKTSNVLEAKYLLSDPLNMVQISSGEGVFNNRGWEFDARYTSSAYGSKLRALGANLTLYNSSVDKKVNHDSENLFKSFLLLGDYNTPDFFYGFNANYKWNRLDVYALFEGSSGMKYYWDAEGIDVDYFGLKSLNVSYLVRLPANLFRDSSTAHFYINMENLLTKANFGGGNMALDYVQHPIFRTISIGTRIKF